MGAILSALADWLAPFLVSISTWFMANIGAKVLISLGLGIATFAGIDTAANALLSQFTSLNTLTGNVAAIAGLLGIPTVISIWVSAITIKVVMIKARAVMVTGSAL